MLPGRTRTAHLYALNAMGGSTQAGPVEVPSSMPRKTHRANSLSSVPRFPLARFAYVRVNFATIVRFLRLSHEDAPRAAQVKPPDTWLIGLRISEQLLPLPAVVHPLHKLSSTDWLAGQLITPIHQVILRLEIITCLYCDRAYSNLL